MNIFIKTTLFFLSLFVLYIATPVFAVNTFFNTKNQSFTQGEEFLMNVFLNTEGESVNAIEGSVVFSTDLLEAREIRDGNSSINFWIEKPRILQSGAIVFSGVTPGGLSNPKAFLFSVVFRAKKEGSETIQIDGLRVLRNDGKGTPVIAKVSPLQFSIFQKSSPILSMIESIKDTELPEDFKPTIANDPNIFDGKWFLVFATQDKSSGINHYEIKESRQRIFSVFQRWFQAESPYVLEDQDLRSYIYVKAVDNSGNKRIAVVEPRHPLKWYKNYVVWIIIIFGVILTYSVWRAINSKIKYLCRWREKSK